MIAYKIKGQHALRRLVLAAGKRVSMHSTCCACKSGLNSRYFQTLKKRVSRIDMTSLTVQAVHDQNLAVCNVKAAILEII